LASGIITTNDALKELNTNKNVKFIDTRDGKAFQQGHIADAVLITNNDLTATINDIPGMAKPGEEIANVFKNKGIDRNNKIIVYSAGTASNDYTYAARIIALLNYVYIKDTYLMDGGYAKWFSEKKGNVNSVEMVSPSKLTYNGTDNKIIVDLNYVSQNLNNKNVIFVDARNADYYNGKDTDTRITRHGHIPGAININVATLTKKVNNYYVLINQNELLNIVYEKGFANPAELLNKTVISYCNTGVSASGDWFVFKYIGTHPDVRIYEGSMSEYSRTNLPLE
jgi:thiosulfate/3-mercaptopyruvate sulfurtransferase